MARKRTINRKELRTDFDEAENKPEEEEADEAEDEDEDADEDEEADADVESDGESDDVEEAPKPKKPKKKPAAPKRTRTPKVVAMKAIWVVFDNSSKEIETFPYNKRSDAEAFLEQKNTDKKGAFYLQMRKIPLEEKKEEEKVETKKKKK